MNSFLSQWNEAALTTLSYFWKVLWAFCLGYVISAVIQVFVTRERMRRAMGSTGPQSVALTTFLGWQFIVGEYAGGVLLILVMIAVVKISEPKALIQQVRQRMQRHRSENGGGRQKDDRENGFPHLHRGLHPHPALEVYRPRFPP